MTSYEVWATDSGNRLLVTSDLEEIRTFLQGYYNQHGIKGLSSLSVGNDEMAISGRQFLRMQKKEVHVSGTCEVIVGFEAPGMKILQEQANPKDYRDQWIFEAGTVEYKFCGKPATVPDGDRCREHS